MNINYTKALLLSYPHIEQLIEQIDDLVLKKALAAFSDFSPCSEIAEKILVLTEKKDVLLKIKVTNDEILSKLTEEEKDLLDYKYFKKKPKEYYADFDYVSRSYFRKQSKIAKKIAYLYTVSGVDDGWFEKNCLPTKLFSNLLKRIVNHEKNMCKNTAKKSKSTNEKVKGKEEVCLKLSA